MQELIDIAAKVAAVLTERKQRVAVAESSAGGLIAASLLAVPGASRYFLGGAVVYTARARRLLTGIPSSFPPGVRSSSEPYALMLAQDARERYGAEWGISETGAAGPRNAQGLGNSYGDAAGHTCLAVAGERIERAITLETGSDDRVTNMYAFAAGSLNLFLETLSR